MAKIVITLKEDDLLELRAILLDEDQAAALTFLQQRIAVQLPVKGTSACDSSRRNPYLLK